VRGAGAYATRRLALAVPLLWIVSVLAYLLLYRAADPVARLRQVPGVRAADIQRLVEQQGLDAPWYTGYWEWLSGFVQGDWGLSTANPGAGARETIVAAIPATLELMGLAIVVSAVLGVTFGVLSATRPGSQLDVQLTGLSYLGFAIPTFLAGVVLQFGAIWMREHGWAVLPFALGTILLRAGRARIRRGGARTIAVATAGAVLILLSVALWGRLGGDGQTVLYTGQRYSFGHEGEWWSLNHLQHLVLPVLTLALVNVAVWSRFQRAVLIDELRSDHVAHARARGLPERRVVIGHALRNTLAPIVTLVALDIGAMFSGAVVTETVFSWPGMGRLLRDAALERDINVAMGIVMIGAVAVVVAGLLADLAYAALDPRVDLRRRS
jgi:ABC-type dipeptide/oligopeptide/nickel transport system permease component